MRVTAELYEAGVEAPILLLAHGAGAGRTHPFMTGFADSMKDRGVSALLFNFPYVEAGRKLPGAASVAIQTWHSVRSFADGLSASSIWVGGKSYGGRMASMAVADGMNAAGLVYLGYPYHPPGKPEAKRSAHLGSIAEPQLFLTGTKDPFVQPIDDFTKDIEQHPLARIELVEGAGHSFEVAGNKRTPDVIARELAPVVASFIASKS